MKKAKPKKRDFVAWAKKHSVPATSVLAWNASPSPVSMTAAQHLVGAPDPDVVARVATHLDALVALTSSSPDRRRRADG
jgi:hypothetical protein